MQTLLEKAIAGLIVDEDKVSLSEMIKCVTPLPVPTTDNKGKSFEVTFSVDISKIHSNLTTDLWYNTLEKIAYFGTYKVKQARAIDLICDELPKVTFTIPTTKTITYDGYNQIEDVVIEKEKYNVPTGETDAEGKPIFVEHERDVARLVPKKVRAIKTKIVQDDKFFGETLPIMITELTNAMVEGMWNELYKLSKNKPFGSPSREVLEPKSIEITNIWSEELNGIVKTISDASWKAMGFDLEIMKTTDLPIDKDSQLSGFERFYPKVKETYVEFMGNDCYVCQVSGKVVSGILVKSVYLYGMGGLFVSNDIHKVLFPLLRKVRYSNYRGSVGNCSVLNFDKRCYTVDTDEAFGSCYGYSLGRLGYPKAISYMTNIDYPFSMAVRYSSTDKPKLEHVSIQKFLVDAGKESLDLPMVDESVVSFDKDGKMVMGTVYELPSPMKFLPKPVIGHRHIAELAFPRGWEPPKALGYKRDTHPVASTSPKPGYRYYGMEIEIENPSKELTSDHITGFVAHNIIKHGFLYGTDGSIQNGLEFRSSPQGFKSLSDNLRGLFNVLETPLRKDFDALGRHSRDLDEDTKYKWDDYEGRWVEAPSKKSPKEPVMLKNQWKTSDRCGLHIHVSRGALTELQLGKILAFVYSKKNRAFMEMVAERTCEKYAEMTSNPPFEVTEGGKIRLVKSKSIGHLKINKDFTDPKTGKVLKSFPVTRFHKVRDYRAGYDGDQSKYTAINTKHEHTIEFRIFKGVQTAEEAITKLQFVDSLMEFTSCNTHNPVPLHESINKDRYLQWLVSDAENRTKYSLLIAFINRKDAASISKVSNVKDIATLERRATTKKDLMALFA